MIKRIINCWTYAWLTSIKHKTEESIGMNIWTLCLFTTVFKQLSLMLIGMWLVFTSCTTYSTWDYGCMASVNHLETIFKYRKQWIDCHSFSFLSFFEYRVSISPGCLRFAISCLSLLGVEITGVYHYAQLSGLLL
jgi:hypothetical protein